MGKKYKNLILITGDEALLKEEKKNEVLKDLGAPGSFNFNTFTDENIDLDEIRRLAETVPFMEERRTILIVNSGLFKKASAEKTSGGKADRKTRDGGTAAGSGAGGASGAAAEIFSGIPGTTVVVFCENETAVTNALYKLVKKNGEIYRFDTVDSARGREKSRARSEVRQWALQRIEDAGRRIDQGTLGFLLELSGYDMLNLSTELEKLISYTLSEKAGYRITRDDVSRICSVSLTDRVFQMAGLKLKGDIPGAVSVLEELFALKVPPMKILSILERQYERYFIVKSCLSEGKGDAEIMEGLEIKDWQLRQAKGDIRFITLSGAREMFEEAVEMDYRIKKGDMTDRLALELLIAGP